MEECPKTAVTSKTGKINNQVKVPIKVRDFENICAITLRLEYNPDIMKFVRCTPAKEFTDHSAPMFFASPVEPIPVGSKQPEPINSMKLMMAYADVKPLTFNRQNRVLFYAYFKCQKVVGETELNFNNEIQGGGMCEYANAQAQALTDTPTKDFYTNGKVIVPKRKK